MHDDDDLPDYPDEGVGFQRHSEASKDGARAANPKKPTQEGLCMDFIRERGAVGATSDEVAEATGIELYIIRARLAGLHKKGLIFGDGRRDGGHGVTVTVWKDIALRPPVEDGQRDLFEQAA
ncbi:hypothetical protein [Sphingopyxis sp. Geo48]|uniref:hypothetical protein n=1 Tax=Sphingopyxis sp. Geo48 TaxID=545241 RepID=UPI0024B67852|nr:hypothetical protein [Sphingopyxis sp. Geo48]